MDQEPDGLIALPATDFETLLERAAETGARRALLEFGRNGQDAADGFRAFEHPGDPFEPALARRLKDHVDVAGDNTAPREAYRALRGRDTDSRARIEKRGMAPAA